LGDGRGELTVKKQNVKYYAKLRSKRWAVHAARIVYIKILLGKAGGKTQAGRLGCILAGNTEMELNGSGVGMNWINVAHHRELWRTLVSTPLNLQISQSAGNTFTS
jgi:hypothetical protein